MTRELDDCVTAYQGGSEYDFDNQILLNWYPKRVLQKCAGATSMLELGLGHGYSTRLFSPAFERHVVLEGSPAVIDNFRQRFPDCGANIVETYFEQFDTAEQFDVIVMGFILEHVEDPALVLSRFRRFLRPGGRLFVAVPNAEVLNRRLGHLAGMLDDVRTLSAHDHELGHRRYYTADQLGADLQHSGYTVRAMEGIYLKPFTTRQMLSLNLPTSVIDALCQVGIDYPELSCGLLAEAIAQPGQS